MVEKEVLLIKINEILTLDINFLEREKMATKNRIIVIGVDGVPLPLLKPWVDEGILPNFKKLMDNGAYGDLKSTTPPLTAPAWVSFATGKNPGKHGIFDFNLRKKGTYEFHLVNSTNRNGSSFWNLASNKGCKVGVVNLPFTYPPEEVNGFIIPGLGAPKRKVSWPSGIEDEIMENVPGFQEMFLMSKAKQTGDRATYYRKEIKKRTKITQETTAYLMDNREWDLFVVYFEETENSHHYAWKYIDPRMEEYHSMGAKPYRGLIKEAYVEVDKAIGEILNRIDDNTYIIVVSDHGYGLRYKLGKHKFAGGLLKERGWAVGKNSRKKEILSRSRIYSILSKLKIYALVARIVPSKVISKLPSEMGIEDLDWQKTRAYSFGDPSYIFINLRGREPEGVVRQEDYDKVREEIIRDFSTIVDPLSNETILEVFKREDVYEGQSLDLAPDLICLPKEIPTNIFKERKETQMFSKDMVNDWHHQNGIFIISGPNMKKGEFKGEIIDIAPTVLYLLGLAIPAEMDGLPLLDTFEDTFRDKFSYIIEEIEGIEEKGQKDALSEKEEEEIKDRLRDLGYSA